MSRNPYAPSDAALEGASAQPPLALDLGLLTHEDFGGFWLRVLAYVIDAAILYPFQAALGYGVLQLANVTLLSAMQVLVLDFALSQVVWAAYNIGFWASALQTTIGKRLCGLVVTSSHLERLSLAHAAARYLATIVSSLIIVGVLTIPVSERRRALHDMIAGTLVVKRRALASVVAAAEAARAER
jgi:uncharacterized RDD family membrane protein YckC